MRNAVFFGIGGEAILAIIGSESAEDFVVVGFDGHAPGAGETNGGGEVAQFSPFVIREEIGSKDRAAGGSGRGASAKARIWFDAVDGCEVIGREVRGRAVTEEAFVIKNEDGNDATWAGQNFAGGGEAGEDFAARSAGLEHGTDVF